MPFLLAIEGIDGSGKGTQAARLHKRLLADGVRATLLSFPRYAETFFGQAVGEFLNGRFGQLDEVDPFLASLLYAGDRFESRQVIFDAFEQQDVLICDRFVSSNVAHQGAKLSGAERQKLVVWVHRIEYGIYQLPRPDLTVLLDLPAAESQKLIARKKPRNYTDKQADLQEADGGYLSNVREVYLQLAQSEPNWRTVSCLRDGSLRNIEDIGEEVWKAVIEAMPVT